MAAKKPSAITQYATALRETLSKESAPARVLTWIVVRKLKDQGIDASPHMASIEQSMNQALATAKGDQFHADIHTGDPAIDNANLDLSQAEFASAIDGFAGVFGDALPDVFSP